MRAGDGVRISSIEANRTFPCSRSIRTRRRSPGAASETKIVFPSAWANPRPPGRIRSTSTIIASQIKGFDAGAATEGRPCNDATTALLCGVLVRRPLLRRWRCAIFLLHAFELKLHAADNSRDPVVNERANRSHDKSEHTVKQRHANHKHDSDDYRTDPTGSSSSSIVTQRKRRHRSAKDYEKQSVD